MGVLVAVVAASTAEAFRGGARTHVEPVVRSLWQRKRLCSEPHAQSHEQAEVPLTLTLHEANVPTHVAEVPVHSPSRHVRDSDPTSRWPTRHVTAHTEPWLSPAEHTITPSLDGSGASAEQCEVDATQAGMAPLQVPAAVQVTVELPCRR